LIKERQLAKILSSLAAIPVRGTFFRSIDYAFLARGTPLSAIGSAAAGGRYNAQHTFEALYLADTPETALFETRALMACGLRLIGVKQPPRVMLALDATLQAALDLEDELNLGALEIGREDLCDPQWRLKCGRGEAVLTHRIGAAARTTNFEALRVPSAVRPLGANLVIFPDRLRKGSRIELYVGDRLEIPRYTLEGGA
jgi:RES domain-containing protein